jgi:2'-5' RNA ligase
MTVHGTLAFPRGRAALAISVTPDVGVRQIDTVSAVEATGADLHHYYRPGQWVPHISVATRANGSQLPTVVRMVSDTLPLTVRVERAALVDSATGQTWPLPHIL